MDYQRNLKYFTPGVVFDLFCIVIVATIIVTIIVEFSTGNPSPAFVIGLLVFLGFLLGSSDGGYSDSEYDAEVTRYADSLKSHALNKLGVDKSEVEEIHPIVLGGYDFEGADKVKEGKDKKWRSNIYKVIMLFFTSDAVHCCTIRFKTTKNLILGEATDVYFYQDIVSVSTYSEHTIKVNGEDRTINCEAFKLTTKGGTSLTVNLLDSRDAQKSVDAMRALLREKKQG